MDISKIHFGHMCFAAATMTGMVTVASMLGHIEPNAMLNCIGVVIGVLVLTPMYANFK